jgi:hypothetical protein
MERSGRSLGEAHTGRGVIAGDGQGLRAEVGGRSTTPNAHSCLFGLRCRYAGRSCSVSGGKRKGGIMRRSCCSDLPLVMEVGSGGGLATCRAAYDPRTWRLLLVPGDSTAFFGLLTSTIILRCVRQVQIVTLHFRGHLREFERHSLQRIVRGSRGVPEWVSDGRGFWTRRLPVQR